MFSEVLKFCTDFLNVFGSFKISLFFPPTAGFPEAYAHPYLT